jgi:hypothetical protein
MFSGVFMHEKTAAVGDKELWGTWMIYVQTNLEASFNMFLRSAALIQEAFFLVKNKTV